jgi:hypothetical protein
MTRRCPSVLALRDVQLGEYVTHMGFDRALADEEPEGDAGVSTQVRRSGGASGKPVLRAAAPRERGVDMLPE